MLGWLANYFSNKRQDARFSQVWHFVQTRASLPEVLVHAARADFQVTSHRIDDPGMVIPADRPQSYDQYSALTEKTISELGKARSGEIVLGEAGSFITLRLRDGVIVSASYSRPGIGPSEPEEKWERSGAAGGK